jgi:hypothetical protein
MLLRHADVKAYNTDRHDITSFECPAGNANVCKLNLIYKVSGSAAGSVIVIVMMFTEFLWHMKHLRRR